LTPFEVYCDYVALKQHFTTESYDYVKYQGKMRLKYETFEKRNDKYSFEKLSKHKDPHGFLLANMVHDPKVWVGTLVRSTDAEKIYEDWRKRQQSLTYTFRDEIGCLENDFNSNFICSDGKHPPLLKKYIRDEISFETLCILLHLTSANKHWDDRMKYDVIWREKSLRISKYTPFISFDENKLKKILLEHFE
jgi:hypothetical protein